MAFQHEKWLLKLLPYYEELEIKADETFKEIKQQLGKAIQNGDIDQGLHFWTKQLDDYVSDYSFRFTLPDHVLLIETYFSLFTIPQLNFVLVERYADILDKLLSKKRILTPGKFVLDWKPLFDVYWKVKYKEYETDDVMMISDELDLNLFMLILKCNPYFSSQATKEILDQMAPYMNPSDDDSMEKVMEIWNLFLPTALTLQQHKEYGASLWFDDLCSWFHGAWNNPPWTLHCIQILWKLSSDSPNFIDWSKHCETIFQIVLRNLDLQINFIGLEDTGENGSKMIISIGHGTKAYPYSTAVLVASMLGDPENKTEKCLGHLYEFVENYLHPSNEGDWAEKVLEFTRDLSEGMCRRVHKERHCDKVDWLEKRNNRLSDKQIDQFVLTILPCAMLAIFNKDHDTIGCEIMKHLSRLAPKLVLPTVIEMQLSALESLTEPHRLTQTLNCTADLLVMMLREDSGVQHQIIPLLSEMIIGIDPNDCDKTIQTAKVMQTVCSLIPLCEFTEYQNINIEKETLPYQTGQIEDLVITLTDKILSFVQSVEDGYAGEASYDEHAIEQPDVAPDVMAVGNQLFSLFRSICRQSSASIMKHIENKLYNFIMESNLGSENAAICTNILLNSFVQNGDQRVFDKFITGLKSEIELAAKGCDLEADILPQSLVSFVRIIHGLFNCNGFYISNSKNQILDLLNLIAPIKSKQIMQHINVIFTNVFCSLCTIRYKQLPEGQSKSLSLHNRCAMRCGRNAGPVEWQIPSNEGLEFAKVLLAKFMTPKLEQLKNQSLSNEARVQLLGTIEACFDGAAESLPPLPGEHLNLLDSVVDFNTCGTTIKRPAHIGVVTMPDGSNVRQAIFDVLHRVLTFLVNTDDSKSMVKVAKLLNKLATSNGRVFVNQEFMDYKARVSDTVLGTKAHFQSITHERAMLCHTIRVLTQGISSAFTQSHILIVKDLLQLATNNYVIVRAVAQKSLENIFSGHSGSYNVVLDEIVDLLKADPASEMDKLKGVLNLVLETDMLVETQWITINKLWPAIVQVHQTEDPAIVGLLENAQSMLINKFQTFPIWAELPPKVLQFANRLQCQSISYNGSSVELYNCAQNKRLYNQLIDTLLTLLSDNHLHWRPQYMANLMLKVLIRIDQPMPDSLLLHFLPLITHHSSATRKRAIEAVTAWHKLNKPPAVKIEPQTNNSLCNLMYKKDNIPTSQGEWDGTVFVNKSCYGVKAWPNDFQINAPASEQQNRNRQLTELVSTEKRIVDKFLNASFQAEFIHRMTAEETDRSLLIESAKMFKGLFCNYNDLLLNHLKPVLEGLMTSEKKERKELALAIISGIIIGSKLWNFCKIQQLWEWLGPLIKKDLETMNDDRMTPWIRMLILLGNVDPRKLHQLHGIMFDVVAENGNRTSQQCTVRLLRAILEKGAWKVMELWNDLLTIIIQSSNFSSEDICLAHARCLQRICWWSAMGFEFDAQPHEKLPQLQEVLLEIQINCGISFDFDQLTITAPENGTIDCPDKNNKQIYYARLVAHTISWMFLDGRMHLTPPFFGFILQLCHLANTTKDDELNGYINYALMAMARAITPKQHLATLLDLCQNNNPQRWKSKVALLSFLHVHVLNNYYSYVSEPQLCSKIIQMVSFFISNENTHVRMVAQKALTDLIRFKIADVEKDLLPNVKHLLKSQKSSEYRDAILTLTAVVRAFPYSVPDFLPRILVLLTKHLANSSYELKDEVSKALFEFKRTHQDGRHEHKNKFTEQQLEIINDSLCAPASYIV